MKIFYSGLFCILTIALSAQLSHSPNPLTITAAPDSGDNKLEISFTNPQDTVYKVYWRLFKDSLTWQSGWATYICDLNLCYNINVDKSAPSQPNNFSQGTHKFEFHFLPNDLPGCTIIGLRLYGDKNFTEEIYRTSININGCVSNVKNTTLVNTQKVYPNPANDFFQVANGENIKKINVYNMFGKELKSFLHFNNAQHDISDLKAGMYVVKLLDEKNKVVKTIKLNKVLEGA